MTRSGAYEIPSAQIALLFARLAEKRYTGEVMVLAHLHEGEVTKVRPLKEDKTA